MAGFWPVSEATPAGRRGGRQAQTALERHRKWCHRSLRPVAEGSYRRVEPGPWPVLIERAAGAIEPLGPTITAQSIKGFARIARRRMRIEGVATGAITFARSPNASKSTRQNFASSGREANCCAPSSPLQAQKRQVLACPVPKWRTDSNVWPPRSERGASVPMAKPTDGWRISLQTSDAGTACLHSTCPSKLMGGPLTMWLHRAEHPCATDAADSLDRRV